MSKLDSLVQDFLAQKKIALVGVSDKRETGCNAGYRKFKEAGWLPRVRAGDVAHTRLSEDELRRAFALCQWTWQNIK